MQTGNQQTSLTLRSTANSVAADSNIARPRPSLLIGLIVMSFLVASCGNPAETKIDRRNLDGQQSNRSSTIEDLDSRTVPGADEKPLSFIGTLGEPKVYFGGRNYHPCDVSRLLKLCDAKNGTLLIAFDEKREDGTRACSYECTARDTGVVPTVTATKVPLQQ